MPIRSLVLSQDLASGATESASAITEISATITQIAAQTRQSADNANQRPIICRWRQNNPAQDGNKLMDDLMVAMQEIDRSGRDITNIIKAIDEIAANQLAGVGLAIEAARAGQHGRGFAVVADGVRNLAARSAEAAKRTASLIAESSQHAVKKGWSWQIKPQLRWLISSPVRRKHRAGGGHCLCCQ